MAFGNKLCYFSIPRADFNNIAAAVNLAPEEFAWRKKIAAQYGSGFDKAMEKLAKRNKFKTKKEYLLSL